MEEQLDDILAVYRIDIRRSTNFADRLGFALRFLFFGKARLVLCRVPKKEE